MFHIAQEQEWASIIYWCGYITPQPPAIFTCTFPSVSMLFPYTTTPSNRPDADKFQLIFYE